MDLFAYKKRISKPAASVLGALMFIMVFISVFGFMLVPKEAQAFLGFMDFTFSVKVGDPVQAIWHVLQKHLLGFIGRLMDKATDFVTGLIRNNFLIKNFLRYDACVTRRRHLGDYLWLHFEGPQNKETRTYLASYVDSFNQGGRSYDAPLGQYLSSQADTYRGFQLSSMSPLDPDYLLKLHKLSDPYSSSLFWYYMLGDQALKAEAEASKATSLSVVSPGLKQEFKASPSAPTKPTSPTGPTAPAPANPALPQDIEAPVIDPVAPNGPDLVQQITAGGFFAPEGEDGFRKAVISKSQEEFKALTHASYDAIFGRIDGKENALFLDIGNLVAGFIDQVLYKAFSANWGDVFVYDEFTDCLNLRVDPLRSAAAKDDSLPEQESNPPLPGLPDACNTGGSAATDLGTVAADGGTGGDTGTIDVDGDGVPDSTGGTGGTGGDVTVDLVNEGEGIKATDGVNPCEASGVNEQNNDYLDCLVNGSCTVNN